MSQDSRGDRGRHQRATRERAARHPLLAQGWEQFWGNHADRPQTPGTSSELTSGRLYRVVAPGGRRRTAINDLSTLRIVPLQHTRRSGPDLTPNRVQSWVTREQRARRLLRNAVRGHKLEHANPARTSSPAVFKTVARPQASVSEVSRRVSDASRKPLATNNRWYYRRHALKLVLIVKSGVQFERELGSGNRLSAAV